MDQEDIAIEILEHYEDVPENFELEHPVGDAPLMGQATPDILIGLPVVFVNTPEAQAPTLPPFTLPDLLDKAVGIADFYNWLETVSSPDHEAFLTNEQCWEHPSDNEEDDEDFIAARNRIAGSKATYNTYAQN